MYLNLLVDYKTTTTNIIKNVRRNFQKHDLRPFCNYIETGRIIQIFGVDLSFNEQHFF